MRERLPDTRRSVTHKFRVGTVEAYIVVGLYEDGRPGEMFFRAGDGLHENYPGMESTMECWCIAVSVLLQEGLWTTVYRKFAHQRFEPSGFTGNPDIPIAKSIVDYIIRWMVIERNIKCVGEDQVSTAGQKAKDRNKDRPADGKKE